MTSSEKLRILNEAISEIRSLCLAVAMERPALRLRFAGLGAMLALVALEITTEQHDPARIDPAGPSATLDELGRALDYD